MQLKVDGHLAIEGGDPVRTRPWATYDKGAVFVSEEDQNAGLRALRSRLYFRYDCRPTAQTETGRLEAKLQSYFGVRHALACHSGTTAIALALMARVEPGSVVATQAFSFAATPSAILLAGCRPLLVELDDDLHLEVEDLRARYSPEVKAVVPVHMRGFAAPMRAVMRFADEVGIPVIEDVVPALGVSLNARRLGTFGVAGAFSTQSDKSINTGEGGFLLTDDTELFARAVVYSGAYEGRCARHFEAPSQVPICDLDYPIFAFRMDEIRAAVHRPPGGNGGHTAGADADRGGLRGRGPRHQEGRGATRHDRLPEPTLQGAGSGSPSGRRIEQADLAGRSQDPEPAAPGVVGTALDRQGTGHLLGRRVEELEPQTAHPDAARRAHQAVQALGRIEGVGLDAGGHPGGAGVDARQGAGIFVADPERPGRQGHREGAGLDRYLRLHGVGGGIDLGQQPAGAVGDPHRRRRDEYAGRTAGHRDACDHPVRPGIDPDHHVVVVGGHPDGVTGGGQPEGQDPDRDGGGDPIRGRIDPDHGLEVVEPGPHAARAAGDAAGQVATADDEGAGGGVLLVRLTGGLKRARIADPNPGQGEPGAAADPDQAPVLVVADPERPETRR